MRDISTIDVDEVHSLVQQTKIDIFEFIQTKLSENQIIPSVGFFQSTLLGLAIDIFSAYSLKENDEEIYIDAFVKSCNEKLKMFRKEKINKK